jgi:hypothetical protein
MNDTTYIPATESADPKGAPQRGVRIVHLVFGVLFLGVAAVWALGVTDVLQFDVSLAVVFPVILILAGAAGLVAMVANTARLRRRTKEPYES